MPSLKTLEARLIKYKKEGDQIYHVWTDSLADAQGIFFLCPKCYEENKGPVGTHGVVCWFKNRGVPDDADPKPGRWNVSPQSTGIDDLEFIGPGSFSVLLLGGCGWHGFVVAGQANTG